MAYYKKKICSHVGCNGYALPNSAYCELHQKEISRDSTSKYKSFYSSMVWRKARKVFLTKPENTWCVECLKENKYTIANTVHHQKGFCDYATFLDSKNWVAICSSCHSKIHTKVTNEELYNQNKENW